MNSDALLRSITNESVAEVFEYLKRACEAGRLMLDGFTTLRESVF